MSTSKSDFSVDLGDLFWAKVGSHPWWPCMIYHTPDGEPFFKQTQRGCIYHVQFLGPLVERAWVHFTSLIPFEGRKKFDEYVQQKLRTTNDKSERAKFEPRFTSCNRDIWAKSWREAEVARNISREKRIEKYGRIPVEARLRRISKSEECEMLKLLSNVPLTVEEEDESLTSYLCKETDLRAKNNPTIDRKALEDELKAQWPSFDIPTKRSYLENKLGIFQTSQIERTKRKSKSTLDQTVQSPNKSLNEETLASGKSSKKRVSEGTVKVEHESRELDVEIHRLIVSPAQYRLQPVCSQCEVYSSAPGQMFKCRGPCGRLLHPSCMRYKNPPPVDNNLPEKFKCPECLSGHFLCGICSKPAGTSAKDPRGVLYECQVRDCGRRYHRICVSSWPGIVTQSTDHDSKSDRPSTFQLLMCPSHSCQTCCLELDGRTHTLAQTESPLLQCVRCPAAFHTGDLCTPAGSVEVSLSHIVCPRHFQNTLSKLSAYKTQHPNWCFSCFNTVTEKLLCESCPAVYHKECLTSPVDDNFVCQSCRLGVFPRYAQIIWAKVMHFRWWPCEIIHARNAPINILNMPHPEGTFPVHFLGSDEYQWVSRGSVLPYELGLKSSAAKDSRGTKSVEKAFTRALLRAPRAHQLYVNHVLKRGLPLSSMHADPLPDEELLPPASMDVDIVVHSRLEEEHKAAAMSEVTHIESYIYADNVWPLVQRALEQRLCHAKCACCSASRTGCSKDTHCVHVSNRSECTPDSCSFGPVDCGNRQFATCRLKSEDERVAVFRTVNRGFGLKANGSFKADQLVTEYVGEVIDLEEANRRIVNALGPSALANISSQRKGFHPLTETYLIRLGPDLDFVVDAHVKGNFARFINHSCEPNMRTECWLVDQKPCVGLFATRPIAPNEELTVDYLAAQFLATGLMGATCLCLCGTDSCISTLNIPSSFQTVTRETTDTTESILIAAQDRPNRKSKQMFRSSIASDIKPAAPSKSGTKDDSSSFSVVSLLAAASSHSSNRRERALIQPSAVAARAAAAKGKPAPTHAEVSTDHQSAALGLRPPPHEDFCYRCGDGGELLLCDKATCSKSFHLHCLGLSSPPAGIWYCPWHYCDHCGHPSTHLCWRCPNSYCAEHANESKIRVDELDNERWEIAKSGLNVVTTPAIISSFRWICTDHVGMNIQGPGHRPQLLSSDKPRLSTKTSGGKTLRIETPTTRNHNREASEVTLDETTKSEKGDCSSNAEPRRIEPLKVTLKRKLKAEMAAKNIAALAMSDTALKVVSADGTRKRPGISSPIMEKKRPRLSKDVSAK